MVTLEACEGWTREWRVWNLGEQVEAAIGEQVRNFQVLIAFGQWHWGGDQGTDV